MKQLATILLLAAAGCTDAADPSISTITAPLTVLTHDCDVDAGYDLDTFAAEQGGKLQIVGVYEARNGDAPWWADPACSACLEDPACGADPASLDEVCHREPTAHAATLHVTGNAETFVLASYEPTNWTITVEPGASLKRLIVSSYAGSTATAPAGITVEQADLGYAYEYYTDAELTARCEDLHDAQYCEGYGEYWYEERQASAAASRDLIAKAEALSGHKLATFHGCYSMSNISFGE
jgi:hypothetical protein